MKVAVVGNYPPKACGISTFTENLVHSIRVNLSCDRIEEFAEIIAIEDTNDQHDYPQEVTRTIQKQHAASYIECARYINQEHFDLVIVQHEFGIFGGPDGKHILLLLEHLTVPAIATFHTVLKEPSVNQKYIVHNMIKWTMKVVVMTELAAKFLREIYEVSDRNIQIIEHGVPDIVTAERKELRAKLGMTGKKVLLTFGLLSRGKGIETVIRALPDIKKAHPDLLYVVLGKTHPNVVKESGEEYRDHLKALADENGVLKNIRFVDEFADEQKLFEYIRACDLYVIPYLNEAQITSGTLAYAVGAGAAVVSTPFWHAVELLAEDRGRLFPFKDDRKLKDIALELLDQPEVLSNLRKNAHDYGQHLKWNVVGGEYVDTMQDAVEQYVEQKNTQLNQIKVPELKLDHLFRLSDDTGLIQHAKYSMPNRHEGYCLDDNGRGFLLTAMLMQEHDDPKLLRLAESYLSYIFHAQREDGLFKNFMNYERRFMEHQGSEDAFGRALWGIGYGIAHPPSSSMIRLLHEIFDRSYVHIENLRSPRALAYGILSLTYYLERYPEDEKMLGILKAQVDRLCRFYTATRSWQWFEAYLTYCNAILPYAVFRSLNFIEDKKIKEIALESTKLLRKHTFPHGYLSPIGCHSPFNPEFSSYNPFDQQPIDAAASVLLFTEAYKITGERTYRQDAIQSFAWFVGHNELGEQLYHTSTGGCYDGLTSNGVNLNEGAESLLAYLIARQTVVQLLNQKEKHTIQNGKTNQLAKFPVTVLQNS